MEKYAGNKGYKILQHQISTPNTASIALHEKLGYETEGYVYLNKKGNDVILYLKAL